MLRSRPDRESGRTAQCASGSDPEIGVVLGVRAHGMTAGGDIAHQVGIGVRHLADHEESGLHAVPVKRIENRLRLARHRAVVEGQDDLAPGQDEIGHAADANGAAAQ